jgi:isoleucyl-tRNA synthetase
MLENQQFSFVEMEKNILEFWQKENIFHKSLEQTKNKTPYIFYDGPPFATGLPHHGHLVASTIKDIIPRYFTMKGRYVLRRFGWDCHGLPIEQEIDKKFGRSAQEIVSEIGVKAYNDECRAIVGRFTSEWEKTISRLGRWVDFKNDYKTMDVGFMESVWWVFNELWKKDLIYQGEKVVAVSSQFGTVLSNFEATSNYQSVQDPSVTILVKLKNKLKNHDVHLSIWTTTPWTLPSNLGVCVNEKITYGIYHHEKLNLHLLMATDRLKAFQKNHGLTLLEEVSGHELVGLKYIPPTSYFSHLENDFENVFTIHGDDYVSTEDGTGLVHLAPGFGEDDHRVMKKTKIPIVCPVDNHGLFTGEIPDLKGLYIKEADKIIIKKLKESGQLLEQSVLVHNYPFCPRSDTPLIYKAIKSWYVNVEKIKSTLIQVNQEIRWVPEHIRDGRFGKWLEGAKDWAISRNRIWGTPLPIWQNNESGKTLCFGSREELQKVCGQFLSDLHREHVDNIVFSLPGEAGTYHRIPEVLDCWFESGAMPYAQLHYPFENKKMFEEGFPAEFIGEGLDQTRGWFYTLTVLSGALYKKPAFKNVIVNGLVLAADGRKMSKRLKNYTPPDEVMEEFGADALRLFLINSGVVRGEELRFTDEGVKDMVRRVLLPWFNAFKFFQTYAQVDGWNFNDHETYGDNILDRWIISRQQTLLEIINNEMAAYRLYNVVPALFDFIEELTNWYIRLNRRRFWEDQLEQDKKSAYTALYLSLKNLSSMMAPFTPYLSEYIFKELNAFAHSQAESVHLTAFPMANKSLMSPDLEKASSLMAQVILLGRQKRNLKQVKVKIPLAQLTIVHKDEKILHEIKKLEFYIKTELNVKEINYSQNEEAFINFFAKPNSPLLGKKLGGQFAKFRGLIEKLSTQELQQVEAGKTIVIDQQEFLPEEILVFRTPKDGSEAMSNSFITINFPTLLDEHLIQEGHAREIISRIQKMRKENQFHVSDRIVATLWAPKQVKDVFTNHGHYIQRETLIEKMIFVDSLHDESMIKIDIDDCDSFNLKIEVLNQ